MKDLLDINFKTTVLNMPKELKGDVEIVKKTIYEKNMNTINRKLEKNLKNKF